MSFFRKWKSKSSQHAFLLLIASVLICMGSGTATGQDFRSLRSSLMPDSVGTQILEQLSSALESCYPNAITMECFRAELQQPHEDATNVFQDVLDSILIEWPNHENQVYLIALDFVSFIERGPLAQGLFNHLMDRYNALTYEEIGALKRLAVRMHEWESVYRITGDLMAADTDILDSLEINHQEIHWNRISALISLDYDEEFLEATNPLLDSLLVISDATWPILQQTVDSYTHLGNLDAAWEIVEQWCNISQYRFPYAADGMYPIAAWLARATGNREEAEIVRTQWEAQLEQRGILDLADSDVLEEYWTSGPDIGERLTEWIQPFAQWFVPYSTTDNIYFLYYPVETTLLSPTNFQVWTISVVSGTARPIQWGPVMQDAEGGSSFAHTNYQMISTGNSLVYHAKHMVWMEDEGVAGSFRLTARNMIWNLHFNWETINETYPPHLGPIAYAPTRNTLFYPVNRITDDEFLLHGLRNDSFRQYRLRPGEHDDLPVDRQWLLGYGEPEIEVGRWSFSPTGAYFTAYDNERNSVLVAATHDISDSLWIPAPDGISSENVELVWSKGGELSGTLFLFDNNSHLFQLWPDDPPESHTLSGRDTEWIGVPLEQDNWRVWGPIPTEGILLVNNDGEVRLVMPECEPIYLWDIPETAVERLEPLPAVKINPQDWICYTTDREVVVRNLTRNAEPSILWRCPEGTPDLPVKTCITW